MSVKILELQGSTGEIGCQHGEALRDEIKLCLEIYQEVIGTPFSKLGARAEAFRGVVGTNTPNLLAELDGIARGADVAAADIMLLNARSELMSVADGCTAVYQPKISALAQTWDWMEALEDLFVVLKIERRDGHQIATVSEPGMLAKIGVNSAGLGCTLNFLYSPGEHTGTPVHFLLRSVLDTSDMCSALNCIETRVPGQTGNIMIGTDQGVGTNIELAGMACSMHPLAEKPFVHTNHHLTKDISAGDLTENSHARYRVAQAKAAESNLSIEKIESILSDTSNVEHPICSTYQPKLGTQIGTVCTVIMDLDNRSLKVRKGPNPQAPFAVQVALDG